MFGRWHHGHSIGAGFMGGLMLASYRIWLLLALTFALGCLAALVIVQGRRLLNWAAQAVDGLVWRMR